MPPSTEAPRLPAAEDLLKASHEILAPLVRLLLSCGIDYVRFAAELKPIFIDQALGELVEHDRRDTDSALSLLSGVHRKDIRQWRIEGLGRRISSKLSLSSQVFAQWVQNPLYRDRFKKPRPLLRIGEEPSFDTLVRSVTQDVHPYTVLTELMRLGLVKVENQNGHERVIPSPEGYVPPPGSAELVELFGANLADHLSSATANLRGVTPAHLEQSVFVEGITPESANELAELARKLWLQSRNEMIAAASRLYEADRDRSEAIHRARFGIYFWDENSSPGNTPDSEKEIDS